MIPMVAVYIAENQTRFVDPKSGKWAFFAFQRGKWRVVNNDHVVYHCDAGHPVDRGGYRTDLEARLKCAQINLKVLASIDSAR